MRHKKCIVKSFLLAWLFPVNLLFPQNTNNYILINTRSSNFEQSLHNSILIKYNNCLEQFSLRTPTTFIREIYTFDDWFLSFVEIYKTNATLFLFPSENKFYISHNVLSTYNITENNPYSLPGFDINNYNNSKLLLFKTKSFYWIFSDRRLHSGGYSTCHENAVIRVRPGIPIEYLKITNEFVFTPLLNNINKTINKIPLRHSSSNDDVSFLHFHTIEPCPSSTSEYFYDIDIYTYPGKGDKFILSKPTLVEIINPYINVISNRILFWQKMNDEYFRTSYETNQTNTHGHVIIKYLERKIQRLLELH